MGSDDENSSNTGLTDGVPALILSELSEVLFVYTTATPTKMAVATAAAAMATAATFLAVVDIPAVVAGVAIVPASILPRKSSSTKLVPLTRPVSAFLGTMVVLHCTRYRATVAFRIVPYNCEALEYR